MSSHDMAQVLLSPMRSLPSAQPTDPEQPPLDLHWSDRDAAALLSINIPLQPRVALGSTSKRPRRVAAPAAPAHAAHARPAIHPRRQPLAPIAIGRKGGTIDSPRKVVKKLCLDNEWRVTDWDRDRAKQGKALHDPARPQGHIDSTIDELVPQTRHQDLAAEDDRELVEANVHPDISVSSNLPPSPSPSPPPEISQSIVEASELPSGLSEEQIPNCGEASTPETAPREQDQSPNATSPHTTKSDAVAYSPPVPSRAHAAPSSSTQSSPNHRMSDDKAILEAFLRRANAIKKPLTRAALRESYENKRDSDVIRLAMASPGRNQILSELDPNSPLPQKCDLLLETTDRSAHRVCNPDQTDISSSTNSSKPVRRSARSRLRHAQSSDESSLPSDPPKIAFRGSARPVTLRATRSGSENSALAETRMNTKTNLGDAVMPSQRLKDLKNSNGDAGVSGVERPETFSRRVANGGLKSVAWNATLVYFEDGTPPQTDAEVMLKSQSELKADVTTTAHDEPKAQEQLVVSKVTDKRLPEDSQPLVAQTIKDAQVLKAAPSTRRSRIATPARGLVTRATASTPGPDTSVKKDPTTSTTASANGKAHPRRRKGTAITAPGLSTSRKIDFAEHDPVSAQKLKADTVSTNLQLNDEQTSTPEHENPTILPPPSASFSFTPAPCAGGLEPKSLSSPPKRRVRRPLNRQEDLNPGPTPLAASLASPAKRPTRRALLGGASPTMGLCVLNLASPAKRPGRRARVLEGSPDSVGLGRSGCSVLSLSSPAKRPVRGRVL